MRDVSPEIAAAYAHDLGRTARSSTFNQHIGFLRLLWRTLRKAARADVNPWEEIKRKRLISYSRRELTLEELRRVCQSATGEMRLLFAVGIYTGLRLGDCVTLRWSEVDMIRGQIRRIPMKTARRNPKPILIALTKDLHTALAAVSRHKTNVLPNLAAQYRRDPSAVAKMVQQHFAANNIRTQAETAPDGRPRAVVEVGFHSLRHTFVSICRARGVALSTVEAIVGHNSPAMTQHYTHVSEHEIARAAAALPSVWENAKAGRKLLPARTTATALKDGIAKIEGMTAKTWGKARAAALADLRAALTEIEAPA